MDTSKYGNLVSCYIYFIVDKLIKADEITKINIVNTALLAVYINKIGIDDSLNVIDPKLLIERTALSIGKQVSVNIIEKNISSVKDLPDGYAILRFDFGDDFWYALFRDRVLLFSFGDNACFKYGKITSARIIEIERIV